MRIRWVDVRLEWDGGAMLCCSNSPKDRRFSMTSPGSEDLAGFCLSGLTALVFLPESLRFPSATWAECSFPILPSATSAEGTAQGSRSQRSGRSRDVEWRRRAGEGVASRSALPRSLLFSIDIGSDGRL